MISFNFSMKYLSNVKLTFHNKLTRFVSIHSLLIALTHDDKIKIASPRCIDSKL